MFPPVAPVLSAGLTVTATPLAPLELTVNTRVGAYTAVAVCAASMVTCKLVELPWLTPSFSQRTNVFAPLVAGAPKVTTVPWSYVRVNCVEPSLALLLSAGLTVTATALAPDEFTVSTCVGTYTAVAVCTASMVTCKLVELPWSTPSFCHFTNRAEPLVAGAPNVTTVPCA